MANRRRFLQSIPAVMATPAVAAAASKSGAKLTSGSRDYFKELGVRPFLNAAGTYTTLTASLMQPEAVAAIDYASRTFVRLNELHDAVGARIAQMVAAEAAMVSSGAAGALLCGTAACSAGTDMEKIDRPPYSTAIKTV